MSCLSREPRRSRLGIENTPIEHDAMLYLGPSPLDFFLFVVVVDVRLRRLSGDRPVLPDPSFRSRELHFFFHDPAPRAL